MLQLFSLTSAVRKMSETIIKEVVSGQFKINNRIVQSQHEVMKGRSSTNLLEFFEVRNMEKMWLKQLMCQMFFNMMTLKGFFKKQN